MEIVLYSEATADVETITSYYGSSFCSAVADVAADAMVAVAASF